MDTGFINSTLDVKTSDGLDDILLEHLEFVKLNDQRIRAPIGGTTDGFSIPRCSQSLVPATGGDWFASVLHDSAYRNQLEIQNLGEWESASFTQKQADDLLLEAMESQGVSWL